MAYEVVSVGDGWPVAPQYTAASDIDILIVNPTNAPLHWVTTVDDTSPGSGGSPLPATVAAKVPALGQLALSLLSGERLWLVCPYLSGGESRSITLQT